jgi:hypothetical protein
MPPPTDPALTHPSVPARFATLRRADGEVGDGGGDKGGGGPDLDRASSVATGGDDDTLGHAQILWAPDRGRGEDERGGERERERERERSAERKG